MLLVAPHLISIFFSSLPTVVGRKITPPQKGCPCLNSRNLWVYYLKWRREINVFDFLLILRWEMILNDQDGTKVISGSLTVEKGGRRRRTRQIKTQKKLDWVLLAFKIEGSHRPRNASSFCKLGKTRKPSPLDFQEDCSSACTLSVAH